MLLGLLLNRVMKPTGLNRYLDSGTISVLTAGSAPTYIYILPYIALFAVWSAYFSPVGLPHLPCSSTASTKMSTILWW